MLFRSGSNGGAATGYGSGGQGSTGGGGGGGGAGVAIKWLANVTPGNTLAVTVGTAASGGTNGAVIIEW